MPFVEGCNVSVQLGGNPILKSVSFDIEEGSWTGLIGPNGSGKTTLLRAMSGLIPHRGTLTLEGRDISAWTPRELARRMAFVRQSTPLSFDFRVEELVMLGRSPHKGWLEQNGKEDYEHVHAALERVDLEDLAHRSVLSLSGGERQRVFLAQALVQEADVLLLDEPTTHLDVRYQFDFMRVVEEMVDDGCTVIAVFHDLELAARHSDQLLVMHDGQLTESGPPKQILRPDLLARVFRVEADVYHPEDELLTIRYRATTSS